MIHSGFETNAPNAAPSRVWAELSVRVGRRKRTLDGDVTAQPLHTNPGERSLYNTSDGLSNRMSKGDRLDAVFLSQNLVLLGEALNQQRWEAALLHGNIQLR